MNRKRVINKDLYISFFSVILDSFLNLLDEYHKYHNQVKGVSVQYPMYFGAKPSIFKLAKELRKSETEAEKILWSKLNKNQIPGLQFR